MKTITEIRVSFWEAHPNLHHWRVKRKGQKYHAGVCTAFTDYVTALRQNGEITESLATRATL